MIFQVESRKTDDQLGLTIRKSRMELIARAKFRYKSVLQIASGITTEQRNMLDVLAMAEKEEHEYLPGALAFSIDTKLSVEGINIIFTHKTKGIQKSMPIDVFVRGYIRGYYVDEIRGSDFGKDYGVSDLMVCLRHFEEMIGDVPYSRELRQLENNILVQRLETLSFPKLPEVNHGAEIWVIEDDTQENHIRLKELSSGIESQDISKQGKSYDDIVIESEIDLISGMSQEIELAEEQLYPEDAIVYYYNYAFEDYQRSNFQRFLLEIYPEFLLRGLYINDKYYSRNVQGQVYSREHYMDLDLNIVGDLVIRIFEDNEFEGDDAQEVIEIIRKELYMPDSEMSAKVETKYSCFYNHIIGMVDVVDGSSEVCITDSIRILKCGQALGVKYKWLRYTLIFEYSIKGKRYKDSISTYECAHIENQNLYVGDTKISEYRFKELTKMFGILKFKYKVNKKIR